MNPIALALIQGGVGFAIGAGTNDLAIRWIFHAVFAKKKRAIAESVRDIISKELMTPEMIAARLAEPDSVAVLESVFEKYLAAACARDLPSIDTLAVENGSTMLVKEAVDSVVAAAADELMKLLSLPDAVRALVDPFGHTAGRLAASVARKVPIGRLDRFARPELRRLVAKRMADECLEFVKRHMGELIGRTHVWDVVYESVVHLDEKEMEAVTRRIANRELHGITWLGGVIGFIVGFGESMLIWALGGYL